MNQPTIIRDTIYKTIEKVAEAKIDNADIYKEIIHSQTETYNFIIIVFFGLITLFLGASWLYNKHLAKGEIIKHTDEIFAKEKEKLIKEFKSEFEIELASMKGESARLFALACNKATPSGISNSFYWWVQCIKFYKKANKGSAVRFCCERAIEALEKFTPNKEKCKKILLDTYNTGNFTIDNCFYDIYKDIPIELRIEREKLIKLTKELFE